MIVIIVLVVLMLLSALKVYCRQPTRLTTAPVTAGLAKTNR